jgi:hypothetical protein
VDGCFQPAPKLGSRAVCCRTSAIPPLLLLLLPAVTFTQGTPFKPYEQLLAVLPSASCALLPGPFQPLMLDPHSPVIDFYPTEFEVSSMACGGMPAMSCKAHHV